MFMVGGVETDRLRRAHPLPGSDITPSHLVAKSMELTPLSTTNHRQGTQSPKEELKTGRSTSNASQRAHQ